jgi:tol-pal system protein YbgF
MRRFLLTASLTALLATSAFAQDVSDLLVRLNRLESQVRQLSGQNEQLQFENKRLSEQLAKFQKDVEFRFQDLQPGAKPGAAPANAKPASPPPPAAAGQKRSDAFDPAAQPGAPGAPQSLGVADIIAKDTQTAPSQPLDLNAMRPGGSVAQAAPQTTSSIIPQGALPARVQGMNPATPAAVQPSVDAYENGMALMSARQYQQAEMAFRQFLTANPRSPNVSNAHFWLGESYLKRNLYTDAAEHYLKIYQSYPQSKVAPEALVKLAVSLRGLGQKQQACATLAEVGRKYPNASSEVRGAVDREQKRADC